MKQLFDYSRSEILAGLHKDKPINLKKPADLARITASLIIERPEKLKEINYMVKLMNKVYFKIPKNSRPELPGKLMSISGDAKNCGTTKEGRHYCVESSVYEGAANNKDGSITGEPWTVKKNDKGSIFIKIGGVFVAGLVFAAWMLGGWVVALGALILSSLIFSDSTKYIIEQIARLLGFILKKTGEIIKSGAEGLGLGNILLLGGGLFAAYIFIKGN